jgi:riboflavin kinase
MSELKVQHILTLAELLSKGARHNFVSVTTSSLGKSINRSQQAASKHLLELERDGYIERIRNGQKVSVRITNKGHAEITKIISGMGEGAYYMSMKGYTKQFKSKLGYIPFPGTLNVKLNDKKFTEAKRELDTHQGIMINGFSDGKRTYGWVKCYPAKINSTVDGMMITLERTHYDDSIIELISKTNIKKTAKLSNGSSISIRVPISTKHE